MSKEEGGERLLRTPGQTDKSISGPEWADRGARGSPTSGRREDGGPRPSQRPARGLSELYQSQGCWRHSTRGRGGEGQSPAAVLGSPARRGCVPAWPAGAQAPLTSGRAHPALPLILRLLTFSFSLALVSCLSSYSWHFLCILICYYFNRVVFIQQIDILYNTVYNVLIVISIFH